MTRSSQVFLAFGVALLLTALPARVSAVQQDSWAQKMHAARAAARAGDQARAERLYRDAVAAAEPSGLDDQRLFIAVNALAALLHAQHRLASAESLYGRALAVYRRHGRTDDAHYASLLAALASVYGQTARLVGAESLYAQALAVDEAALGTEDRKVATTLVALAGVRIRQADYDSAVPLLERALAIYRSVPGDANLAVATALNNLALAEENRGHLHRAESLYVESIRIREVAFGPNDVQLASTLTNLAALYRRRADVAAAESVYARALAIREAAAGPDDATLVPILANLGLMHEAQGKADDAEAAFARAVTLYHHLALDQDQVYGLVASGLGAIYLVRERYADAEPLLLDAIRVYEAVLGPDHPEVGRTLDLYARLLSLTERVAEAKIVQRRADEILGRRPREAAPPPAARGVVHAGRDTRSLKVDPRPIYSPADTVDGRPVLTDYPQQIDCPVYDPQQRPTRPRVDDRYEPAEARPMEFMPLKVEALLELVVGLDGKPERKHTKVLRTTDWRMDKSIMSWVRSCRFRPGKIGDQPVRVRIEFPVEMTFVRGE